jgi:LPS-assembly protein
MSFIAWPSWAIPVLKKNQNTSPVSPPAILKADEVTGDQINNILIASGNVEIVKGSAIIYADQITYNKNGGLIRAIGNVKIKNIEIGNVKATSAEIKDDFSSGKFLDTKMIFNDGSYLISPEIERKTPLITILQNTTFSICPNPQIIINNDLAGKKRDFFSIKSRTTTIDREKQIMVSKGSIMRFYNVPFFYTPFIQVPLSTKKKQSGFLNPSYIKSTNLGVGLSTPYYFYIAPNMDLTVSPFIGISNNQILISNEFRHIASYGQYLTNFEVGNNKITSSNNTTVVDRTSKQYRWNLTGEGVFDFTENIGLDFSANIVSDRDYLRDYHYSYLNYTSSKLNVDYIKGRNYYAIKTIKIQELENIDYEKAAPLILPQIDSYIETRPLFYKEKFALTSNMTVISRDDGLQYRRVSLTPEVSLPFNLQGNLFNLDARVQTDGYSLENNFKDIAVTNDYNSFESNYKPEFSIGWRLPLIKKSQTNTLMIEPMANIVVSSYGKNFNNFPDEDSNDAELTVSNLFVPDRISGFDRNEAGKRINYGVKTSFFNNYGEFGLNIGQGYRASSGSQDVTISGFADNNKSNIVGQAIYKSTRYLTLSYSFQLNESNYSNDINQLSATLNFDRITLSSDYLLIRTTSQNSTKKEQIRFASTVKISEGWNVILSINEDLVTGRTLTRGVTINRIGCCTIVGFSVIETNPSTLIKPQKTFNISLSFKNL